MHPYLQPAVGKEAEEGPVALLPDVIEVVAGVIPKAARDRMYSPPELYTVSMCSRMPTVTLDTAKTLRAGVEPRDAHVDQPETDRVVPGREGCRESPAVEGVVEGLLVDGLNGAGHVGRDPCGIIPDPV